MMGDRWVMGPTETHHHTEADVERASKLFRDRCNPFVNEDLRAAFDLGWQHARESRGFDAPWVYEHAHRVAYGRGFAARAKLTPTSEPWS